jgi:hypothetical protein
MKGILTTTQKMAVGNEEAAVASKLKKTKEFY